MTMPPKATIAGLVQRQVATTQPGKKGRGRCVHYAMIGQAFLRDLGIETRIEIGHAIVVLGKADNDLLAFGQLPATFHGSVSLVAGGNIEAHAILVTEDAVIDFSWIEWPEMAKAVAEATGPWSKEARQRLKKWPRFYWGPRSKILAKPNAGKPGQIEWQELT